MTKRTYRYRQWLKYLKSDEYALFERYCYKLEIELALESILNNLPDDLKKKKDDLVNELLMFNSCSVNYDEIDYFGRK